MHSIFFVSLSHERNKPSNLRNYFNELTEELTTLLMQGIYIRRKGKSGALATVMMDILDWTTIRQIKHHTGCYISNGCTICAVYTSCYVAFLDNASRKRNDCAFRLLRQLERLTDPILRDDPFSGHVH